MVVLTILIYLGIYLGTKYSKNSDTGEESNDKKWGIVGGFLGGIVGLVIIIGLYFYINVKPNIQKIIVSQSRIVKNKNALENLKNLLNIS